MNLVGECYFMSLAALTPACRGYAFGPKRVSVDMSGSSPPTLTKR